MENKTGIKALIDLFMSKKRIAFVGVSAKEKSFSRVLFNEFIKRGYDMVPVNPSQTQIAGLLCYKNVSEINPLVEAVLIMTNPKAAADILKDFQSAGIDLIWLYRSLGQGVVSPEAILFGKENSLNLIPGYCPYIFWKDSGLIHSLHRLIMKIGGKYPE